MENKRGLSDVITTLIIILLVLVAVGIIWVVVRNVVQSGSEQIEITTRCVAVDLRAVSVTSVEGQAGNYTVTLQRRAGGDTIDGVRLVFLNATEASEVLYFGGGDLEFSQLQTLTRSVNTDTGEEGSYSLLDATRMEYTAYFKDASGNEQYCTTTTFNF